MSNENDADHRYASRKGDKDFHDGDECECDDLEVWGLHVARTNNGFVVSGLEGVVVFEDNDCLDTTGTDPDTMARLLWYVIEYYGAIGSRHDARRVTVSVGPGDKYSGPMPVCNRH